MVAVTITTILQAFVVLAAARDMLLSNFPKSDSDSVSTAPGGPNPIAAPYAILAKPGALLRQIDPSIGDLFDKGGRLRIIHGGVRFQGYCTNLTEAQIISLSKYSPVEWILPATSKGCRNVLKNTPPKRLDKRAPPRVPPPVPHGLKQDESSFTQLKLLSEPPLTPNEVSRIPLPDYLYDPKRGEGQDIYIVDDGFNIYHEEIRRQITGKYAVPNEVACKGLSPDECPSTPNTIAETTGHGTQVASVAAGNNTGVAPKANLILVKTVVSGLDPLTNAGPIFNDVSRWILERVARRKNKEGFEGQSIVSISSSSRKLSKELSPAETELVAAWDKVLQSAWKLDIIVVCSAGNAGTDNSVSLENFLPARLGSPNNALITIGGIESDGTLAWFTTQKRGPFGSITGYTLAVKVWVAAPFSNWDLKTNEGTSFAAPAYAGMIAYFASLDSLKNRWTKGSVPMIMKKFVIDRAWKRAQNPFDSDSGASKPPGYSLPDPESIVVGYNGAWAGLSNTNDPFADEC